MPILCVIIYITSEKRCLLNFPQALHTNDYQKLPQHSTNTSLYTDSQYKSRKVQKPHRLRDIDIADPSNNVA